MRTNRIIDPATTSVSTWSAAGGTRDIVGGKLRVTPGGTATCYVYGNPGSGYATAGRHNISPGDNYALRCEVTNPTSTPNYVRWGAVFYNSTGGQSGAPSNLSSVMTLGPGETVLVELFGNLPASATTTTGMLPLLYTYSTPGGGIATVDNVTDSTRWQVEVGPTAPTDDPMDFFYGGDSSIFTAWTGAANASPSIMYVTNPTLTPFDDDSPCPRVLVVFGEFIPGTASVTLHRITEDGDVVVPGVDRAPASGGLIKTDYYPPYLTDVTYRGEMFNAAGVSIGFTASTVTQVLCYDATITSPTNPRLHVRVDMDASAGGQLVNPVDASVHNIDGRRILIAEAGYGLDGVGLTFWTDTLEQYRAALQVFRDSLNLVVFRIPPPMLVPRVLYAFGVPGRSETNMNVLEEVMWELEGTEVSPPTTQIIAAQLTYRRYRDYYPTYRAFKDATGTYKNALLNPPPEV